MWNVEDFSPTAPPAYLGRTGYEQRYDQKEGWQQERIEEKSLQVLRLLAPFNGRKEQVMGGPGYPGCPGYKSGVLS